MAPKDEPCNRTPSCFCLVHGTGNRLAVRHGDAEMGYRWVNRWMVTLPMRDISAERGEAQRLQY
jgi:hypothetical protein